MKLENMVFLWFSVVVVVLILPKGGGVLHFNLDLGLWFQSLGRATVKALLIGAQPPVVHKNPINHD
jgi:hypothetical protein